MASCKSAEASAAAIWPEFAIADNPSIRQARNCLQSCIDADTPGNDPDATARDGYTQKQWTKLMDDRLAKLRYARAEPDDKARLNAYTTETACTWTGAIPSKTLDTALTSEEFCDNIALQLGVDVQDEVLPCTFCVMPCDMRGRHALSCTAGGDNTCEHNELRDEVYAWCQRARFRPELEKSGLLHDLELPGGRRRPADVLVCHRPALLHGLPGGPAAEGTTKVALDLAVINALGQGQHQLTFEGQLRAAIAYSKTKREHLRTHEKCAENGIAFEPLVFEAQGGVEPRAAAILHRIAESVATVEGRDTAACKREFLQCLAVIVARNSSRAIRRRAAMRPRADGNRRAERGIKRALEESAADSAATSSGRELFF